MFFVVLGARLNLAFARRTSLKWADGSVAGVPLMFRVSYQSVLRVSLVSFGLLVCGAVAQDQPDAKSADKSATDTPAKDAAGTPQAKPTPDAVDPLTRPINEKQRKNC